MNLDTRVAALVEPFQTGLRAYAFGPELEAMAAELQRLLQVHRTQRTGLHDRVRLKALSLLAEYLDAFGRAGEAALLLKASVKELRETMPEWSNEIAAASELERISLRRLIRQRVWCCLSYAVCLLRANQFDEAGAILSRLREFVDGVLVDARRFPCHGTIALLRYYQGVINRNQGRLNEAAWDFDAALDGLRLRFEEKEAKHARTDPERLKREAIYRQVNTARILGFGHGGIALSRGRYVEARAWMTAAQQILAQSGQEVWRRGLEVYGCCAAVLVQQVHPASVPALTASAAQLKESAAWFQGRNRRNAGIAEAFAILAEVRLQQIRQWEAGESILMLRLDGLLPRLEPCLREIYRDSGPLSAAAALRLIGCLLRAKELTRCQRELVRFQKAFGQQGDGLAEFQVLQAEVWIETGRREAARALLMELVEQRPVNRAFRARAWALLAWCEHRSGQVIWAERSLAAARDALTQVQDGFTKVLVDEIATEIMPAMKQAAGAMPYQAAGEDVRWCDLDYNLEAARLHVVEAVHRRHPGYSVEKLAALMGRGPSWLYGFLALHRDVEWVNRILSRAR